MLCGLSSQLQQIEVLRFVVGLGMALFFGSSVTLITRYFGRGSEGFAIASLNSAHSIGGIIGIFGWDSSYRSSRMETKLIVKWRLWLD